MANLHLCIIVPAAHQALAQSLCAGLAGDAGADMLTSGLSATGTAPATHYISAGIIGEEFAVLMDDPAVLYQTCLSHSIAVTEQQCISILDASDISSEEPLVAMARLGLQIIEVNI